MNPSLFRPLLLAGAVCAAGCTFNINGKGTVNAEGEANGGGGNGGGGSGNGDGGGDDGGGGDGGGGGNASIEGIFVIDIHDVDTYFLCDVYWDLNGTETSCSGCDIAFDVSLTNESGSCGIGSDSGGLLEWANGGAYFEGNYIGQGSLTGTGIAYFYTPGYVYGGTYLYYYYGGGYY